MKKMKKVFAMLLALAMVLGMSMTAFAANDNDDAKITVNNIAKPTGDGTNGTIGNPEIQYVKVITPAAVTETDKTGWAFVGGADGAYAQAYIEAYGAVGADNTAKAKAVIEALIAEAETNDFTGNASKAKQAISNVKNVVAADSWKTVAAADVNAAKGSATWSVADEGPGVYIVKIGQTNYSYASMAAYVGFNGMRVVTNPDGSTSYEYPDIIPAVLTAKGSDSATKPEKENDTNHNTAPVGKTVEYTIDTVVPYVEYDRIQSLGDFVVVDTLTGATYDQTSVKVKFADTTTDNAITLPDGAVTFEVFEENGDTKQKMTINLTNLLADNSNANRPIEITYNASVVSEDGVTNTAQAGHKKGEDFNPVYGGDNDYVFSGEITITKKDAADGTKLLGGAGFEVRMSDTNGNSTGDALKFTPVYKAGSTTDVDYYKYDPNAISGTVTTIVTNNVDSDPAKGTVVVKGLDLGKYWFKEVTAPEGYSINAEDVFAEITTEKDKVEVQSDIINGAKDMLDTQLSALPSTGGIGTTIFTVAGCLIMVIAAGLFFASRRKSVKA